MASNVLENFVMDSSLRCLYQRFAEIPRLKRMACLPEGRGILEIGCGTGMETDLIIRHFRPAEVTAMDSRSSAVLKAAQREFAVPVSFLTGDLRDLPFPDGSFDAVFCLGVLHHIPEWRDGLAGIVRVLKPGGIFVSEELPLESFASRAGPLVRLLTDHPYESLFDWAEFRDELLRLGMSGLKTEVLAVLGLIDVCLTTARK